MISVYFLFAACTIAAMIMISMDNAADITPYTTIMLPHFLQYMIITLSFTDYA